MNGAAVVVAAMRAAAALSLPVNLTAIIPVCENMPSGMAMKCGDVVMGLNGKSIMIRDTDNEGRLLLADAMTYGQKEHKPKLVVGKKLIFCRSTHVVDISHFLKHFHSLHQLHDLHSHLVISCG